MESSSQFLAIRVQLIIDSRFKVKITDHHNVATRTITKTCSQNQLVRSGEWWKGS